MLSYHANRQIQLIKETKEARSIPQQIHPVIHPFIHWSIHSFIPDIYVAPILQPSFRRCIRSSICLSFHSYIKCIYWSIYPCIHSYIQLIHPLISPSIHPPRPPVLDQRSCAVYLSQVVVRWRMSRLSLCTWRHSCLAVIRTDCALLSSVVSCRRRMGHEEGAPSCESQNNLHLDWAQISKWRLLQTIAIFLLQFHQFLLCALCLRCYKSHQTYNYYYIAFSSFIIFITSSRLLATGPEPPTDYPLDNPSALMQCSWINCCPAFGFWSGTLEVCRLRLRLPLLFFCVLWNIIMKQLTIYIRL